jgi:NTE family protein
MGPEHSDLKANSEDALREQTPNNAYAVHAVPSAVDGMEGADQVEPGTPTAAGAGRTAFVFGGGGRWGAVQVGMVEALLDAGITPDLVLGTSIGAFNGAMVAADPTHAGVTRLRSLWHEIQDLDVLSASLLQRARTVISERISLHRTSDLRAVLARYLPTDRFEDLAVPFECVAATIETAAERWFDAGSLTDAILASSAVPGLFPPFEIDGRNYYDGGLVNSVPVDHAVRRDATTVHVLQVGRLEQPLRRPERMHEAALIAFEIARRNRFATSMESLPEQVTVHVLPSGNLIAFDDRRQLRWKDLGETSALMDGARDATATYLSDMEIV